MSAMNQAYLESMDLLIKSITFEYLAKGEQAGHKEFLFDPEEGIYGPSLKDQSKEFNLFFKALITNPKLEAGSTSISWEDGVRAALPFPSKEKRGSLGTVVDLIDHIMGIMALLPPSQNYMMQVAERVGHSNPASSEPSNSL